MNMTIEVQPTIEVIFKARNGIMAKNDFIAAVLYFLIFTNLYEALLEVDIMATVVIALDEDFLTVELFENFDCFCCLTPEHITEDINDVARTNYRVPSVNQRPVVFCDGLERAVVKCETVGVPEV